MSQIRQGSGPAAVLAGSLGAFPLLDVLELVGRTGNGGNVHVVAEGIEAHLRVIGSSVLDPSGTLAERLYELASHNDAWFTVTPSASPADDTDNVAKVTIESLIEDVKPRVAEWLTLIASLPVGSVARMAQSSPGPEIQIRAEQWRILSVIGAGRPVHDVVALAGDHPVETLRVIQALADAQLITVEIPAPPAPHTAPEPPAERAAQTAQTAAAPAQPAVTGDTAAPSARPDPPSLEPATTGASVSSALVSAAAAGIGARRRAHSGSRVANRPTALATRTATVTTSARTTPASATPQSPDPPASPPTQRADAPRSPDAATSPEETPAPFMPPPLAPNPWPQSPLPGVSEPSAADAAAV